MNVLLLSLSTFPKDHEMTTSTYLYLDKNGKTICDANGHELTVDGIYQLDPIPNLLKKQGVILDHIVVLGTEATVEKKWHVVADNYLEDEEITVFDYFVRTNLADKIPADKPVEHAVHLVRIDAGDAAPAIREAVNLIQTFIGEEGMNLYIDTHGGFRTTQKAIDAISSLLFKKGIDKKVFSVYFTNQVGRIVEETSDKLFDFVSGINEFMNYGRIDSLLRYLDQGSDAGIVEPIKKISNGIQWCNLFDFELGLRQLKNYYKKGVDEEGDIYLSIFADRIQADYGPLLKEGDIDAIDMVEWCVRKGFYQQALTIVESRAASALISRGIISYTPDGLAFKNKYSTKRNSTMPVADTDIWNGCVFRFRGTIDWFAEDKPAQKFNAIFESEDSSQKKIEEVIALISKKKRSLSWEELVDSSRYCELRTAFLHESGRELLRVACVDSEENKAYALQIADRIPAEKYAALVLLHKVIKDIRNTSNHAAESSPYHPMAVKSALETYTALVKSIS